MKIALALGCSLMAQPAAAEYSCPGTVRIVVPIPAGTTTDVLTRYLADRLAPRLGKPVVVVNMEGAQGAIAARHVAGAAPDGCTLLMMINGLFAVEPMLGAQDWDPRSFTPVSTFAHSTLVFAVNPIVPAHTFAEFLAYAREQRGLNIGASAGSAILSAKLLVARAGVPALRAIPYKSEPQAVQEVTGGVDLCCVFAMVATTEELAAAGKLRVLAVVDSKRSSILPHVPAVTDAVSWFDDLADIAPLSSLVAPPGVLPQSAEELSRHVREILSEGITAGYFRRRGAEPAGSTPQELSVYIESQVPLWSRIVKDAGLAPVQ